RPRTAMAGGESRSGTKIPRPRGHAGSSPAPGTIGSPFLPAPPASAQATTPSRLCGSAGGSTDARISAICDHGRAPSRRAAPGAHVPSPYRLVRLYRHRRAGHRARVDVVTGLVVGGGGGRSARGDGPGRRAADPFDPAPPVSADRAFPLPVRVGPDRDPPVRP